MAGNTASEEETEESRERYHEGHTWYSAAGSREVLIIVSRETQGQDVVPRNEGKLSTNDERRLTSEGIPSESWNQDGALMFSRYKTDHKMNPVPLEDNLHKKRQEVIDEILKRLNNTEQDGVTAHYIGPGRKYTGDWCFSDGFVTFKDIEKLYLKYLENCQEKVKTLVIASDCSYSGNWVEACKRFLNRHGVQPCGHSAWASKIRIKVFCSCQPNEIGSTLLYSAKGNLNDKNTGAKYVVTDKEIAPGQTTCFVDSTKIVCKKKPEEQCQLKPTFTYEEKMTRDRIIHKFQETDQFGGSWRVIVLEDDQDTRETFKEKTRVKNTGNSPSDMSMYGRISREKLSLKNAEDWISRMKDGLEDIDYRTDFM